jgi:hypothetical protein
VPSDSGQDLKGASSSSSSRDGREYLKTALLQHPLWEDMSFWDEACWCASQFGLSSSSSLCLLLFSSWRAFGPCHTTTTSFARLLVSRLRPCHRQSISASLKEGDRSGGSAASWHDCGPSETRDAVLRVHNIVFSQVQRPNYHE